MNFRFEDEEQKKAKGKLLISHSSHTTIELNNISIENSGNSSSCVEKEHMFDKVVTPSDVGKLNRLVIPKQHAEKYFPLDLSTKEKGLVLNFEDNKNGKQWRFRYSYWYSSQSYVMTKGWSRFVKEKKLHAGDIVSFQRVIGQSGKDCLYIDWRRPPEAPHPHNFSWSPNLLMRPQILSAATLMSREQHLLLTQQLNYKLNPYYYVSQNSCSYGNVVRSTPVVYFRSAAQRVLKNGGGREPPVFEPVPVVEGKAASKRLRLFGVNMDCPVTTETDDQDNCEVLSSTTMSYAPLISNPLQLSSSSSRSPVAVDIRRYSGMPLLGMPNSNQQHNHDKGKSTNSIPFDFDR